MRIGIDIDDTLTNLYEYTIAYGQMYDYEELEKDSMINPYGYDTPFIFEWSDEEDKSFWEKYIEEIVTKVNPRPFAVSVIERLRREGHEIYIITARSNLWYKNPYKISEEWLLKNKIEYDKLVVSARDKVKACKENDIDIHIDDSNKHLKELTEAGIPVLLYDNVFNKKSDTKLSIRVYSWPQIYNEIQKLTKREKNEKTN
ncbi:MAG: hypothetical protein N4A47_07180 [Clostridia bacterium]|jgi:uncharacterized HAD superfamily protein|nr:hypothetical protein [Clostridia bacterium]